MANLCNCEFPTCDVCKRGVLTGTERIRELEARLASIEVMVSKVALAEHEEMDRWKRLPKWAQQELERWREDEAHQRARAEVAEERVRELETMLDDAGCR